MACSGPTWCSARFTTECGCDASALHCTALHCTALQPRWNSALRRAVNTSAACRSLIARCAAFSAHSVPGHGVASRSEDGRVDQPQLHRADVLVAAAWAHPGTVSSAGLTTVGGCEAASGTCGTLRLPVPSTCRRQGRAPHCSIAATFCSITPHSECTSSQEHYTALSECVL